jgi:hypothetical protein
LQNRYHSKLKRVREKVVKAVGPTGEEECLVVDDEDMEGGENREGKEGQKRVRRKKVKGSVREEDKEGEHESGSDVEKSPSALLALSPVESREKGDKEDEEKRVSIARPHMPASSHTHLFHIVVAKAGLQMHVGWML